jgi:hypothetical protein
MLPYYQYVTCFGVEEDVYIKLAEAVTMRCEENLIGVKFGQVGLQLHRAIGFHAFAPLEALPCVCPMSFL